MITITNLRVVYTNGLCALYMNPICVGTECWRIYGDAFYEYVATAIKLHMELGTVLNP